jgi:HK97 family phage major capsid protein
MNIAELRQRRAALIAEVRTISSKGSVLSADDLTKVAAIEKDIDNLEANIALHERNEKRSKELAQETGSVVKSGSGDAEGQAKSQALAFRGFLKHGLGQMAPELRQHLQFETRDLAADSAAAGGNIVAPTQFVGDLIKKMDDILHIRQFATKYTLNQAAAGITPTISANAADADWTTEVQAVSADATLAFGKRTLTPSMLSKLIKVSIKLMEVASIPAESIVRDQLAYVFALAQEKAFLTGSGTGQPLGLFTASANGISTGRDMATDNAATAFTPDGLSNAVYSVKQQYRKNGKWLMHRDAVKMARKLKTGISGDLTYLWQPGLTAGQPDTLMGYPVLESEFVPNTFTSGLYVGLFGDLSKYWILDQLPFAIQRLVELYAGTNQVGFIGRMSTDAAPVDELAFARVKLG